jgi:hypothetical protein
MRAGGDFLDEESGRLHESLRHGLEDVAAGRTMGARQLMQKLKRRGAGP